jgi:hypothetical protein
VDTEAAAEADALGVTGADSSTLGIFWVRVVRRGVTLEVLRSNNKWLMPKGGITGAEVEETEEDEANAAGSAEVAEAAAEEAEAEATAEPLMLEW